MTQTVSNAVAEQQNDVANTVTTYKSRIAAVLPDHITGDQFVGLALGAIYRDPKLHEAANNNPGAFMNALMRCASLGHQPGTEEFYLIPRKKQGRPEVQGIEGYRGIVERMYRSGAVASVIVREVCAEDKFRYVEGVTDRPQHNFSGADTHNTNATGADFFGPSGTRRRGEMVGVYAYAILTTGSVSRVVILSRDDVMAAKASSDGAESKFSPWNRLDGGPDHPEFTGRSMWWKTAARRLEPWVPTSAQYRLELARAAGEAQRAANGPAAPTVPPQPVWDGDVIDGTAGGEDDWPEPAKPGGGQS